MKKQEVKVPTQEAEAKVMLDWDRLITEKQEEMERNGQKISKVGAYMRICDEWGLKGEIINMRAVMR
jgi:hypothetical protein